MVDQVEAMPLRSFEYGGVIRTPRKGVFLIDRRTATQLEAMGQIKVVEQAGDPIQAAGGQQSASPAAQALPQMTSSVSASGAKLGRKRKQGE